MGSQSSPSTEAETKCSGGPLGRTSSFRTRCFVGSIDSSWRGPAKRICWIGYIFSSQDAPQVQVEVSGNCCLCFRVLVRRSNNERHRDSATGGQRSTLACCPRDTRKGGLPLRKRRIHKFEGFRSWTCWTSSPEVEDRSLSGAECPKAP